MARVELAGCVPVDQVRARMAARFGPASIHPARGIGSRRSFQVRTGDRRVLVRVFAKPKRTRVVVEAPVPLWALFFGALGAYIIHATRGADVRAFEEHVASAVRAPATPAFRPAAPARPAAVTFQRAR